MKFIDSLVTRFFGSLITLAVVFYVLAHSFRYLMDVVEPYLPLAGLLIVLILIGRLIYLRRQQW